MILSDVSIENRLARIHEDPTRIRITPFDYSALQGASVDLKLAYEAIYKNKLIDLNSIPPFLLPPGESILASTLEHVYTPSDCVARVEGKSSIGRQFVVIHCTAGWIDPGFYGNITLEIVNLHNYNSFLLLPKMWIAQLTYLELDRPAMRQYQGKYQGDVGTQAHKPDKVPYFDNWPK